MKGSWSYSRQRKSDESDDDDERIIKILDLDGSWCRLLTLFWRGLSGHIIIFCIVFQIRSLVELVARIEEIQKVQFVLFYVYIIMFTIFIC